MDQINPVTQQVSPSVTAPKQNMRVFIGALFIFLLGGACGLVLSSRIRPSTLSSSPSSSSPSPTVFLPSPTPDETANWKTYVNTAYGYQLKYPNNWSVTREELGTQVLTQFSELHPKTLVNFTVTVSQKKFNDLYVELKTIVTQYNGSIDVYPTDTTAVQAYQALYLTGPNNSDYVVDRILGTNNHTYRIQASFANPPDQQELKEFNKILSTFQRIDENQSSTKDQIKIFIDEYMKAVIQRDWTTLKTYLSPDVKDFSQDIMSSYGIQKYQIVSIVDTPNNFGGYYATVRMWGQNGTSMKNPQGDPQFLLYKNNGKWSTPTWYFFQ